MRKKKIRLYLRCRQSDGKQSPYCPTLFDSKSLMRPFWCAVKGVAEHRPEGFYYQRMEREGKQAWMSLWAPGGSGVWTGSHSFSSGWVRF